MTSSDAAVRTADAVEAKGSWSAFARRHAVAIALIIVFAALLAGPRLWLAATDPPDGVRIAFTPWGGSNMGSDETLYMPTIRDAYDGHIPVSDTFLIEHQDDTPQGGTAVQTAIGVLGHATGGPTRAFLLVTTLCALATFALFYILTLEWTGSRFAALAVIPVVLLAVHVFNRATDSCRSATGTSCTRC